VKETRAFGVFAACANAIMQGVLINRVSSTNKAFHFQNWFEDRLRSAGVLFDRSGRNSYPDFTLVEFTEGYEAKGLAWPGSGLEENPHTTATVKSRRVTTTGVTSSMCLGATQRLRRLEMNIQSSTLSSATVTSSMLITSTFTRTGVSKASVVMVIS